MQQLGRAGVLSTGAFTKLRVGQGYAANNAKLSGLVQDLQLFRSELSKWEVLAAYKDNRYDLPSETPWRFPLHARGALPGLVHWGVAQITRCHTGLLLRTCLLLCIGLLLCTGL